MFDYNNYYYKAKIAPYIEAKFATDLHVGRYITHLQSPLVSIMNIFWQCVLASFVLNVQYKFFFFKTIP